MRALILLLASLFLFQISFAQDIYERNGKVKANVSLENVIVNNNVIEFDLYVQTSQGTSGDLFLGNADFVISYDANQFVNPMFSKVISTDKTLIQKGYNSLTSTNLQNQTDFNTKLEVQKTYFDATSTVIKAEQLVINISGPTPSDQRTVEQVVAKIDGQVSTHCLGKFSISGLKGNDLDAAGLNWKINDRGLSTKMFTIHTGDQYSSSVEITDGQIVEGFQTVVEPTVNVEFTGLQLSPNPTEGWTQLSFETDRDQDLTVTIVDLSGKIVTDQQWKVTKGLNTLELNVGKLPSGVYQVTAGRSTSKLVKF